MKTDRVLWSKELLSAQSLAHLVEAELSETDHPRWPAAISVPITPDGVTIEFTPHVADWQGADQVVVALYVPPGAEPYAQIRIDSGSSTPGLRGNDYVRCYYRYLHEGWGHIEFPYENMLIFGTPDRWRQVTGVHLRLSGQGQGESRLGHLS